MHAVKLNLDVVKSDEVNKNREEQRGVRSIKRARGLSPQVFYLIALALCSMDQLSSS